jgi:hypothetical protein
MAEYDRRWRPGCRRNYVDAHDEVWQAVQRGPGQFSREIFGRSCRSNLACWKWASIDSNCWVCEGPGPVVGELCYQGDGADYKRWLPACGGCMAWYRAGPAEDVFDPVAEHAGP